MNHQINTLKSFEADAKQLELRIKEYQQRIDENKKKINSLENELMVAKQFQIKSQELQSLLANANS